MAAPVYVTGDVPTADEVNEFMVNVNYARKLSTESVTSNTTLQNDDALVVAVDANAVYVLTCMVKYDGAAAGDIKIGWSVPAGCELDFVAQALATTAALYTDDQNFTGEESSVATFGALGTGTVAAIQMTGLVVVGGTAGNVQFQWAQGTSSATATRVFANSFLDLRRVS